LLQRKPSHVESADKPACAVARVLAPDLIGYGQSGRWPEGRVYEADADIRVIMELAGRAGGPVHLVGHSYGAAMALEAARLLGSGRVRGMTLIEPVAFHLLLAGGYAKEHETRAGRSPV
jgi:pimeloyl-ACP methyl ester carboxylesterase